MTRFGRVTLTLAIAGALGAALPAGTAMARGTVAAAKGRAAKKARKKVKSLLHKAGISKLPSVSSALAGRSGSGQLATAVVGTPPALVEIPGQPIKDLFWQPGVIDAIAASTADQNQCSEFYAGGIDGVSGGLGACHMAESVGYSFSDILQGDSSLCYMKRVPTAANVAAGGVTVTSGSLPGNDITRVFSVPRGTHSRVVKVAVSGDPGGGGGGQDVFLRVYGEAANHAAGNFYRVDLWFCKNGPSAPARGYDNITIDTAGHFVDVSSETESGDGDGGAHISTVEGYLTFTDGNVAYDTSRPRRAEVESQWGDQSFKSAIEIRTDDTMTVKAYDAGTYGARKAYAVSSFAGTGPDSLRFLAGAFHEQQAQDGVTFDHNQTGATEYRDSFYAAAPGSELVAQLDEVDLDSDDFFANPPAPEVDVSGFACDTTPDVELTLDFTNPTVASATAVCEDRRFNGMHFCHDDSDVQDAERNYGPACWPGPH